MKAHPWDVNVGRSTVFGLLGGAACFTLAVMLVGALQSGVLPADRTGPVADVVGVILQTLVGTGVFLLLFGIIFWAVDTGSSYRYLGRAAEYELHYPVDARFYLRRQARHVLAVAMPYALLLVLVNLVIFILRSAERPGLSLWELGSAVLSPCLLLLGSLFFLVLASQNLETHRHRLSPGSKVILSVLSVGLYSLLLWPAARLPLAGLLLLGSYLLSRRLRIVAEGSLELLPSGSATGWSIGREKERVPKAESLLRTRSGFWGSWQRIAAYSVLRATFRWRNVELASFTSLAVWVLSIGDSFLWIPLVVVLPVLLFLWAEFPGREVYPPFENLPFDRRKLHLLAVLPPVLFASALMLSEWRWAGSGDFLLADRTSGGTLEVAGPLQHSAFLSFERVRRPSEEGGAAPMTGRLLGFLPVTIVSPNVSIESRTLERVPFGSGRSGRNLEEILSGFLGASSALPELAPGSQGLQGRSRLHLGDFRPGARFGFRLLQFLFVLNILFFVLRRGLEEPEGEGELISIRRKGRETRQRRTSWLLEDSPWGSPGRIVGFPAVLLVLGALLWVLPAAQAFLQSSTMPFWDRLALSIRAAEVTTVSHLNLLYSYSVLAAVKHLWLAGPLSVLLTVFHTLRLARTLGEVQPGELSAPEGEPMA